MKAQKPGLHPRNRHHQRYDLPALCQAHPDLQGYITLNPLGEQTIDFANPQAVKALNKALLAHFYAVKHWDIPDGFLCPPVPGRADYIHHLADLLAGDSGEVPKDATILDIGTGANLIYPLIGAHEYGWRFTGSEINPQAFASAQAIINGNPGLTRQIRLRRQKESQAIFHGVIHKNETYDATLCNPPFHDSAESARAGGERKRRNLGLGAESFDKHLPGASVLPVEQSSAHASATPVRVDEGADDGGRGLVNASQNAHGRHRANVPLRVQADDRVDPVAPVLALHHVRDVVDGGAPNGVIVVFDQGDKRVHGGGIAADHGPPAQPEVITRVRDGPGRREALRKSCHA